MLSGTQTEFRSGIFMLIVPITQHEFDLYALSLRRGPNFDPLVFHSAWKAGEGVSIAAVLHDEQGGFATLVMRRQTDHRFVVTHETKRLTTLDTATREAIEAMRPDDPPEALKPGMKRRPILVPTTADGLGDTFKLLVTTMTHMPALIAIGETYLAMPCPDNNFVSDFRTGNFDSRLWELYLLAAFREMGITVTQDQPSPDFLIERDGHECYVEAVTANPIERVAGYPPPVHAPANKAERLLGAPAIRFAKTLRSKLQREYEQTPHVKGKPFALAIADYHASGSMTWSSEALPSYLYGVHPQVVDGLQGKRVIGQTVSVLRGKDQIPAGLFRDPAMAHLSAVIFSNAGTISKFNRMGFLAGWRPPNLRMVRSGHLFDRTPGALESIVFEHDILSDEYTAMWPGGEAWCQELEVYHNPLAAHPIPFDLLPGATHWFEANGEIQCLTIWQWSVLSSVTYLSPKD
jgi:hypothetical protein